MSRLVWRHSLFVVVPPLESPSERLGTLETRALNLRLDSSLSGRPLDITENFWHRLGANATTLFEQYVSWLERDMNLHHNHKHSSREW